MGMHEFSEIAKCQGAVSISLPSPTLPTPCMRNRWHKFDPNVPPANILLLVPPFAKGSEFINMMEEEGNRKDADKLEKELKTNGFADTRPFNSEPG